MWQARWPGAWACLNSDREAVISLSHLEMK
jgi:hypothetical protein